MERKVYPSDISREQFEVIRGLLEGAKRHMASSKHDLYEVFCARLYLLKNARTLPDASKCSWEPRLRLPSAANCTSLS